MSLDKQSGADERQRKIAIALTNAKSWHHGDKWRESEKENEKLAWQAQMDAINDAIAALQAQPSAPANPNAMQSQAICRDDGRCQYAIDVCMEESGHCPEGKCCMPANDAAVAQSELVWAAQEAHRRLTFLIQTDPNERAIQSLKVIRDRVCAAIAAAPQQTVAAMSNPDIKTVLTAPQVRGFAVCDGGGYQDDKNSNWEFTDAGLQKLAYAVESAVLAASNHIVDANKMVAAIAEKDADAVRYRDLLAAVIAEMPHRVKGTRGNAPGHGHSVKGIWDSDNGVLAGKECAWCRVWNEACAALQSAGDGDKTA